MEYVQAVLLQIEAAKMEKAEGPQGLLAELDEHRRFLEQQPGFQDMRVIRSINREGDVQLVVETRWQDDESLVEYETREPTVMSIINKYQDLIIPGSLQVVDMEALRTETWRGLTPAAAEVRQRLALPLLLPAGAFLFGVLVIYGLSRIFLEIRPVEIGDLSVATPLALAIALAIFGVSWYLATRPVSGRQVAAIAGVAVALLLGGAIFAAVHEEAEPEGAAAEVTPVATETPPTGGAGAVLEIAMVPVNAFDKTELTVEAGREVTVRFDNRDTGIPHNWALYTDETASQPIAGANEKICSAPCTDEVTFGPLDPGTYFFRCDVHPTQMVGTLVVR